MWKHALKVWLVALFHNFRLTAELLILFILLNFFFLVPVINAFSFFIHNVINFSIIIYFSKLYIKVKGDEKRYEEEIERTTLLQALRTYLPHAITLTLATYAMTTAYLVILFVSMLIVGVITGITLLNYGTDIIIAYLVYLLLMLILYFWIVTSYPAFFARTVIEGETPKDFFFLFLTAPFSKLLWKLSFSLEVFFSSFVIGLISLFVFLIQSILSYLFPPLIFLTYFVAFANFLLIYLFGVVSVSYLMWKREEK